MCCMIAPITTRAPSAMASHPPRRHLPGSGRIRIACPAPQQTPSERCHPARLRCRQSPSPARPAHTKAAPTPGSRPRGRPAALLPPNLPCRVLDRVSPTRQQYGQNARDPRRCNRVRSRAQDRHAVRHKFSGQVRGVWPPNWTITPLSGCSRRQCSARVPV